MTLAGKKRFLTIKGVGVGFFNDLAGNRIIDVTKATDIKFAFEIKNKPLAGGDSLFPFGTMLTDATGSMAITDATLDFNLHQAQTNRPVQYGVAATVWSIGEQWAIPSTSPYTVTLANAATISGDPLVRFMDGSGALAKVAAVPATGEYSIAAGVLTFATADAGKALTIDYQYTVASTDVAGTPSDPGVLYGTYIHTVKYMNPITSHEGHIQFEVFRCAYSGKMEVGMKRSDAAQPAFSLDIFDPGRVDKLVIAHKILD